MFTNVADAVRPRGPGYWQGVPTRVFSGKSSDQLAEIRKRCGQMNGVALWDWKGFTNRFGQSVEDFVAEYQRTKPVERFVCEHIPRNCPCKLLFDVEYDAIRNNTDPHLIARLTKRLVQICMQQLLHHFPHLNDAELGNDVIVLYANTPVKGSAHLIFQIVFKDIFHVKQFVEDHIVPVLEKEPLFSVLSKDGKHVVSAVDLGVYAADRIFRICGSSKYENGQSKNNPLLPEDLRTFDWKCLMRSFVSVVAVADEDVRVVESSDALKMVLRTKEVWTCQQHPLKRSAAKMTIPSDVHPSGKKRTHVSNVTVNTPSHFPNAESMVERVLASHPLLRIQNRSHIQRFPVELDQRGVHKVKIVIKSLNNPNAIVCGGKGSAHKRNSVYFHLNLKKREGYFACPDVACNGKNVWGRRSYAEYITERPQFSTEALVALDTVREDL
jgi:hypothetical protein